MKRTLLVFGAIGLVCALLVTRLLFKQQGGFVTEREWFAKAIRYEFSARVDTVWMLNQHNGRLRCVLTSGNPQIHREDSLKTLFKEHDMLYLIFKRSGDSITFILPEHANLVECGDSVHVSSQANTICFFRNGNQVVSDPLSDALTGFGRPFFLRRK